MSTTSRLSELASIIQHHTSKVDAFLLSKGLPSPSFGPNTALELPNAVRDSQNTILQATDELSALVQGPLPFLMDMVTSQYTSLISLQAICRFKIATSFPLDGQASFVQISQRCNLSQSDTERLLRHAMTYRIFEELQQGVITHTAASRVIAEIPLAREWIESTCDEMLPSASRTLDAITRWPGSEEPHETGFNIAFDTPDPFYTAIGKDAHRAKSFADCMSFCHSLPGLEVSHILNNYNWGGIANEADGSAVLVDIGGSHGYASIEIAQRFPSIECIVQDRPEIVAEAKILPHLRGRVRFMAHDFFAEQPIKGADVYFFRWILHNWSDKYAIQILRALLPALKHGARVVVNEMCIPGHREVPLYHERLVRTYDLGMKETLNAKERDAGDWVRLFHDAHPQFKLQEIITPPSSDLAMIVVLWEGETGFLAV